jgi:hypothetical protein
MLSLFTMENATSVGIKSMGDLNWLFACAFKIALYIKRC